MKLLLIYGSQCHENLLYFLLLTLAFTISNCVAKELCLCEGNLTIAGLRSFNTEIMYLKLYREASGAQAKLKSVQERHP